MASDQFRFPPDFLWGTATASYQIEGAATEDGRGPSIWDTFSHEQGRVANGDTGDVACDHYHRWPQDLDLMRGLNLKAYRFSVAWPRVFPQGRGALNEVGLDFYSRLVDGLLESGLIPFATLYHWDLPQALEDEGGWLNRKIVDDYVNYADTVTRALGDRVKHWITFNEPWVFTWLGYTFGTHAPGHITGNPADALKASHHVLLAHGRAVPVIRANVPDADVGITFSLTHVEPETPTPADMAAAARFDGYNNRWYLDPVLKGEYPVDMMETYAIWAPEVQPGDLETIAAPIDFVGVNYYFRTVVADEPEQFGLQIRQVTQEDQPHTAMGWEISPHGLYALLMRLHEEYNVPALYVTENGAAFEDTLTEDGRVHDAERVDYLRRHFEAAQHALDDGVPLKGYFVWSLLDNFEWAEGYAKRFGICYVDYPTQRRFLKDSAHFVAEVAAHTYRQG